MGDGAALASSAAVAVWTASGGASAPWAIVLQAGILIWSLHAVDVYGLGERDGLGRRSVRVLAGFGLAWAVIAILGWVFGRSSMPPIPGAWFFIDLPLILVLHRLWQAKTADWRRQGRLTPNILIVGATESAGRLIERIGASGEAAVLGIFDDRSSRAPTEVAGVKVLGDTAQLVGHRLLPFVDRVVIAVPARAQARIAHLMATLDSLPNEIMLLVEQEGQAGELAAFSRISRSVLQRMAGKPADERRALVKRAQDVIVGAIAVTVAAPALLAVAIAIRLDSPGPILFRQRRHGFNNEEIVVFKFRSMRAEAADAEAGRQVRARDERVTRVGRFIRKTSLDELPQLFNVMKGEMSLVGPRPHAVGMRTGEVESAKLVAGYAHRHRIKPGMTGWAAIHGSRGPLATAAEVGRRVALDVEYIERQSFWLDLWIMLATIPCLIGDRRRVR
ncbi:MAG: exopolysaccharide biosynthesis polyprenyl glycosylphosphotransferase [Caulobacteraceae bacterium]